MHVVKFETGSQLLLMFVCVQRVRNRGTTQPASADRQETTMRPLEARACYPSFGQSSLSRADETF